MLCLGHGPKPTAAGESSPSAINHRKKQVCWRADVDFTHQSGWFERGYKDLRRMVTSSATLERMPLTLATSFAAY